MDYLTPILFFAGIGVAAGVILTVAAKLFAVEGNVIVKKLTEQLPGTNCGACGFANCSKYAEAIAAEKVAPNQCKPGGVAVAEKIGEVLGKSVNAAEPETAFVFCNGKPPNSPDSSAIDEKYRYNGGQSCRACELYYNGKNSCRFGCTGLGDCVAICPENAISLVNSIAVVDSRRCTACGLCIKACPKNIIRVQSTGQRVNVACSSKDFGAKVKSVCVTGCIGCKICIKKCPQSAIQMRDNLAEINAELCDNCGICASSCPMKSIVKS
ncbi:MAG: RnfABCDGE type electron transport complex subunit B [Oscillospiraceae bacterium]|nr:RnfABCDGE type electron transport complex subunit B [Oscillospiraceae bacterium]